MISGLPNRLNPPRADPEFVSKRQPSEAAAITMVIYGVSSFFPPTHLVQPAIAGYPITRPRTAISPLGG